METELRRSQTETVQQPQVQTTKDTSLDTAMFPPRAPEMSVGVQPEEATIDVAPHENSIGADVNRISGKASTALFPAVLGAFYAGLAVMDFSIGKPVAGGIVLACAALFSLIALSRAKS